VVDTTMWFPGDFPWENLVDPYPVTGLQTFLVTNESTIFKPSLTGSPFCYKEGPFARRNLIGFQFSTKSIDEEFKDDIAADVATGV